MFTRVAQPTDSISSQDVRGNFQKQDTRDLFWKSRACEINYGARNSFPQVSSCCRRPSNPGRHQEHAQRLFSTFFIILTYPHFLGVNSFSSFYEIDDI